ncbi:ABC-2 type transport system permease protein [Candidatus Termititenax dinenymphae]|uniref:Transport permease protein n=1 Tax=Candidatus Termititenax dinenymphae TaxID=2218523 RepID=A0A388TKL7_9BACT|nr:ABC-2 type transport system permease protein [Candidatus Termititenax dinenymphae]
MNKWVREINAIITIAIRDILILFKTPSYFIFSLIMPLIFMGILGGSLSQNMAGDLGYDYGQFLLVGMIINQLLMGTTGGITSLVEDRTEDFTQELMVSPISRYSIIVGKIVGSSFSAILQLLGTLLTAFIMGIHYSIWQLLAVLAISPIICLTAGSLGMIIVAFVKDNRTAGMVQMLVTMPQMFLTGVFIPINHSKGILLILSRLMPMTYCLDLARAVFFYGTAGYKNIVLFNPVFDLLIIAALTVLFLFIGTFFFARSETNR